MDKLIPSKVKPTMQNAGGPCGDMVFRSLKPSPGCDNIWILAVLGLFALVYGLSLTFVYADPNDAMSIEYHALGRHEEIQEPFERFQLGMDWLLCGLPADEPLVRTTAMAVTSVAAVCLVILMLLLAHEFLGPVSAGLKTLLAFVLLVASPELFYLGLLYTPMLVGMCFAISAHLLMRKTSSECLDEGRLRIRRGLLLLSAMCMGLAGIFRWDILVYGLMIVLDVLLDPTEHFTVGEKSPSQRARMTAGWAVLAAVVWFAIELLVLDLPHAIRPMLDAAKETAAETNLKDVRMLASHAMFFGPVFVIGFVAGWGRAVVAGGRWRWFVLATTILAAVWPFWSTPKEVLVFVPSFIIFFSLGFRYLWSVLRIGPKNAYVKIAIGVLLVAPWIFGLQMALAESSWGPGFGLRSFARPAGEGRQSARVVVGPGAAFPSSEGVRPIFGHGFVLLGGKWRQFATGNAAEVDAAVKHALDNSLPLATFEFYDAYLMNAAVRRGYSTTDPMQGKHDERPSIRHLTNDQGTTVVLFRVPVRVLTADTATVIGAIAATRSRKMVCWSEPGQMRLLYLFAPSALKELGPRSAILDLQVLLEAVRAKQAPGA